MWAFTNPLHPAIHPAVRQMDAEVVQMVVNLFNGKQGEACGAFTTGGTESILMAMKVRNILNYIIYLISTSTRNSFLIT